MKVLVVKMSSMGDVIHCLPAVTDLSHALPEVEIHWVVEEGFADIVSLHPNVHEVIPVAIRRWRKNWFRHWSEVRAFRARLKSQTYDAVVDAQGLIKSALVASMAKGEVSGFARDSAREPLASLSYKQALSVAKSSHAIARQRRLFASRFGYELTPGFSYGLQPENTIADNSVFFLHGTTWASKHWPDQHWCDLARLCNEQGFKVKLSFLNDAEERRAAIIAEAADNVEILPRGSLLDLTVHLAGSIAAVTMDTGLGHLAAALNVPLVGLYGPTSPELTGMHGPKQISLAQPDIECAPCFNAQCRYAANDEAAEKYKQETHSSNIYPPCFAGLDPSRVFQQLQTQIAKGRP